MSNTVPSHKEPGYNHGHVPHVNVFPDTYASVSIPYKAASRIINVLEDLHYQMQKPEAERFINYPIAEYEAIDTFIRDNMANLALSIETRELSEGSSD